MKFIRFCNENEISHGLLEEGNRVVEIRWPDQARHMDLRIKTGRTFELDNVKLLAPCQPSKIICLGLNYRSHAEEMKFDLPKKPIIFMKPSTTVIGPGQEIRYPPQSKRVDYETELAVVMGRPAYRVDRSAALGYVFGYTCANDVTARDKQPAAGQWTYAKSFDTFCPLGPAIETAIEDPDDLVIRGYLNGKLVQESSTADHIFRVAEIIEFVSGCMTLLPEDVIITGTPSGIGPMMPGDKFSITIDKIGTLTNTVRDEK